MFGASGTWLSPTADAPHDGSKIPAEKIYTDGCGFINRAALVTIARNMGYAEPPTAVQGRIFGSKGLWILHPHDHHVIKGHPPMIWIRSSQQKVQLSIFDAHTETFDEIRRVLEGIDINRLTPVEALLKLNEIKGLLK